MLVSVAQFAAGVDKPANRATARQLIADAAARGSALVVLPENAMYSNPDQSADIGEDAEAIDGPFTQTLSAAAANAGIVVVAGMTEQSGADERCSNAVVAIDEQGDTIGVYRKVHLYDAFGHRESDRIVPHDPAALVFKRDGLTFGVMTCYDLRFPEMARFLIDAGADVLVIPAAWAVGPAKEDHWLTLARARAIENTAYVMACGQTGPHCAGHSAIIDPMGNVIASAGEAVGVAATSIDHERVVAVREKNPSLANRRFNATYATT